MTSKLHAKPDLSPRRLTIHELSRLAKISVRTLHYYDEIGLLKPAYIGANRYRYYEAKQWLRLQQILLYRETAMPLETIKAILDRPDFDVISALLQHKATLIKEAHHIDQRLKVINKTLQSLKKDQAMTPHSLTPEGLYDWPSEEKQAAFEAWLIEHYGQDWPDLPMQIEQSKAHLLAQSPDDRAADQMRLKTLESDLVQAFLHGLKPGSEALRPILDQHRAWVARQWGRDCPPAAYEGLADLYEHSAEFVERYETLATGFSAYLSAIMRAYAKPLA